MQLRVVPEIGLNQIMQNIVLAAQASTDTAGSSVRQGTIDPDRLRAAALAAVAIATGDVCWPAGEKLRLPAPKPAPSIVEMAG